MEARIAVPLYKRFVDILIALFFILNMPLAVLVDAQALFPKEYFPTAARDLMKWHINTTGDFLMRDKPAFFRAGVFAEVFVQFPLMAINAYAFILGKDWGRITGIIYGVHAATCMIPILGEVSLSDVATKTAILAVYGPYFIIPLLIVARLAPYQHPFTRPTTSKEKKSR